MPRMATKARQFLRNQQCKAAEVHYMRLINVDRAKVSERLIHLPGLSGEGSRVGRQLLGA